MPLPDGWGPDEPSRDTILRAYLDGWAELVEGAGRALGARWARDHDVAMLDVDPPALFSRPCVALRPPVDDWPDRLGRIRDFYGSTFGVTGPFWLVSAWPAPDLSTFGAEGVGHPPFMLRSATGEPADRRPDPEGVEIVEMRDAAIMRDFERALVAGFGMAADEPDVHALYRHPGWLDIPGWRMWLAYLDGEPVATSAVHCAQGLNRVEWIATVESARGRGIGEAMTWRATLAEPTWPAALIATDLGRPVYERMGYLTVLRFSNWVVARP